MEAEREMFESLGYREGKNSERDVWVGLLAETEPRGGLGQLGKICCIAG